MAKQEYEKNLFLLNLCKVELESLIEILRGYINDSKVVLDELFVAGGPDIFRRYDAYNITVLDVINRSRQFASHLREHDITNLAMPSSDSVKIDPVNQLKLNRSSSFPRLDLWSFQIGSEFQGWVTHIEDEGELMFYICQNQEETQPNISEVKPMTLSGIDSLPNSRIFGMRFIDDEQIRRVVFKQPTQLFLIDVGKTINVPPDGGAEYYELPSKYERMPSQAINCKLATMSVSPPREGSEEVFVNGSDVEILRGIANNFVTLKVLANSGKYLTVNLVKPNDELWIQVNDDKQLTLMQSIALNSYINVTTTDVESVDIFYGYIDSPLQKMLIWIEDELPVKPNKLYIPSMGELVLVNCPTDARWYRAKVLYYNKKTTMYQVFFVDFGNRESVPLSCLAQCHLSEQSAPFRALRCRLENRDDAILENNIEMETYEALCEYVLNKTIRMLVKGRTEDALVVKFVTKQSK